MIPVTRHTSISVTSALKMYPKTRPTRDAALRAVFFSFLKLSILT